MLSASWPEVDVELLQRGFLDGPRLVAQGVALGEALEAPRGGGR